MNLLRLSAPLIFVVLFIILAVGLYELTNRMVSMYNLPAKTKYVGYVITIGLLYLCIRERKLILSDINYVKTGPK